MIVYLKFVIYNFGEEINSLLEEKKKTAAKEKDFIESVKINLDLIDSLYLEPKFNIFYLISFLFDINLKIYLITGDFLNPEDESKSIITEEDGNENSLCPTFIVGYFYSSYHILYKPDFNNKLFNNELTNDNPKITQLCYVFKVKKKCDVCFNDTNHIVFLRKQFMVCIQCLFNKIKQIFKERRKEFYKGKCFGIEYYCRPIHLQDDFYLDDYEFIELFSEKNMIKELSGSGQCAKCEATAKESNLLKLPCGCSYCEDCFDKIIEQITNGFGMLLDCECTLYKTSFECACKKKYKYKDICNYYEKDEEDIEQAKVRMYEYITRLCMICLKDLLREGDIKRVKMRKDTNVMEHFMCVKCYKSCFQEINETNNEEAEEEENEDDTKDMPKDTQSSTKKSKPKKKKVINKEEQKVFCSICSTWHDYRDTDAGGCQCLIF